LELAFATIIEMIKVAELSGTSIQQIKSTAHVFAVVDEVDVVMIKSTFFPKNASFHHVLKANLMLLIGHLISLWNRSSSSSFSLDLRWVMWRC
jgi:hypothetical protein